MDTEFVFLILLLFGVLMVAIVRVATHLEQVVKSKPYHIHIQLTLSDDGKHYIFNKALDLTIPPAVGQIIQDKGGFRVTEVLPYQSGEKFCCTARCETLNTERKDLDSCLRSLLENGWQLDTQKSEPLPKHLANREGLDIRISDGT